MGTDRIDYCQHFSRDFHLKVFFGPKSPSVAFSRKCCSTLEVLFLKSQLTEFSPHTLQALSGQVIIIIITQAKFETKLGMTTSARVFFFISARGRDVALSRWKQIEAMFCFLKMLPCTSETYVDITATSGKRWGTALPQHEPRWCETEGVVSNLCSVRLSWPRRELKANWARAVPCPSSVSWMSRAFVPRLDIPSVRNVNGGAV